MFRAANSCWIISSNLTEVYQPKQKWLTIYFWNQSPTITWRTKQQTLIQPSLPKVEFKNDSQVEIECNTSTKLWNLYVSYLKGFGNCTVWRRLDNEKILRGYKKNITLNSMHLLYTLFIIHRTQEIRKDKSVRLLIYTVSLLGILFFTARIWSASLLSDAEGVATDIILN